MESHSWMKLSHRNCAAELHSVQLVTHTDPTGTKTYAAVHCCGAKRDVNFYIPRGQNRQDLRRGRQAAPLLWMITRLHVCMHLLHISRDIEELLQLWFNSLRTLSSNHLWEAAEQVSSGDMNITLKCYSAGDLCGIVCVNLWSDRLSCTETYHYARASLVYYFIKIFMSCANFKLTKRYNLQLLLLYKSSAHRMIGNQTG